ncbi:MAG TPA: methyl-accepting chemotaxis protein [Clostridia bacterium]
MTNIRSKLILACAVILSVLIVSSIITFIGFNSLNKVLIGISPENERANNINKLKSLMYEEQSVVAESIIGLQDTKKEDFKKLNDSAKDIIEKLSANADEKDLQILKNLSSLNNEYSSMFDSKVFPGIQAAKKDKLLELMSGYRTEYKSLLDNEQNLKNSINEGLSQKVTNDEQVNEKDLDLLTSSVRLIYWSLRKYSALNEAVIFMDGDASLLKNAESEMKKTLNDLDGELKGNDKVLLKNIIAGNSRINALASPILDNIKEKKSLGFTELYNGMSGLTEKYGKAAQDLDTSFKEYLSDDLRKQRAIFMSLAAIILIALITGMLLSYMIYNILSAVKKLSMVLGKAEKGDLTERVEVQRKDEVGQLTELVNRQLDGHLKTLRQLETTAKSINALKGKMNEVLGLSRENAGKISTGIKSIAGKVKKGVLSSCEGFNSIFKFDSDGTSDMTSKVVSEGMKVVETAASGERLATDAQEAVKRVTKTVIEMADAVKNLEASSGKVGTITNTIKEFASRTNLLALNAAIEAARAGQQGKGFAVLAAEIRKLADGSKKAAEEIKIQVTEIQEGITTAARNMNEGVKDVESGEKKINEVRISINEVISSVKSLVEIVVGASSNDLGQKNVTEKLKKAVGDMERAASEAAAATEGIDKNMENENARIRHEMELLSVNIDEAYGKLNEMLGQYKL